jgi:hypothetical protein
VGHNNRNFHFDDLHLHLHIHLHCLYISKIQASFTDSWIYTCQENTGHFIMFSMITHIYNKKTKVPTLMKLFTATGELNKSFLTTRDVQCVHHGWHSTHQYNIQVFATHVSTWLHWYSSLLQWCTHRTSLVVKKGLFSFPEAVNNSINIGPLVFLV